MSKKITAIVPAPAEVSLLFSNGEDHYVNAPACLALISTGEVVPMVPYNGRLVLATEVGSFVGIYDDEEVEEVIAKKMENNTDEKES